MSKLKWSLDDAFWHPRLGLVVCYMVSAEYETHSALLRSFILYADIREEEAPALLQFVLNSDTGGGA